LTPQFVKVLVLPMQHEPPAKAEGEGEILAGDAGGGGVVAEESGCEEPADPSSDAGSEPSSEAAEAGIEEQLAQWRERAMRASADLENFRKRMARERAEDRRYANQGLLEELLPVLDNFEMGLQAAAADKESMIFRGMEMVKKQLDDFMSGQGVEEIRADGQVFDPNLHEAVMQEQCPETEEGVVLRVIRNGYRMHDRLLRPASVVVAKGPAAGEDPEGEGTDA
jgi:molecular chaperone GrpE